MKLFELSLFAAALGAFSTLPASAETPAIPPIVTKVLADMPVTFAQAHALHGA